MFRWLYLLCQPEMLQQAMITLLFLGRHRSLFSSSVTHSSDNQQTGPLLRHKNNHWELYPHSHHHEAQVHLPSMQAPFSLLALHPGLPFQVPAPRHTLGRSRTWSTRASAFSQVMFPGVLLLCRSFTQCCCSCLLFSGGSWGHGKLPSPGLGHYF